MTADVTTGIGLRTRADRKNSTVNAALAEELLETAITVASARMCAAPTLEEKMAAWREMCGLIDQRTPARVRFMERVRGL